MLFFGHAIRRIHLGRSGCAVDPLASPSAVSESSASGVVSLRDGVPPARPDRCSWPKTCSPPPTAAPQQRLPCSTLRRYQLRGLLFCGICQRRKQSNVNRGLPHDRAAGPGRAEPAADTSAALRCRRFQPAGRREARREPRTTEDWPTDPRPSGLRRDDASGGDSGRWDGLGAA